MAEKILIDNPFPFIGRGSKQKAKQADEHKVESSQRDGVDENEQEIKATFYIKRRHRNIVRDYAYWHHKKMGRLLGHIIDEYFKGKKVKPIPADEKWEDL